MQVLPKLLFKVPFCWCTVCFECIFFIWKCFFAQNIGIPHTHNFVSHIIFFYYILFWGCFVASCVQMIFYRRYHTYVLSLYFFAPVLLPLLFAVALYYFYAALMQWVGSMPPSTIIALQLKIYVMWHLVTTVHLKLFLVTSRLLLDACFSRVCLCIANCCTVLPNAFLLWSAVLITIPILTIIHIYNLKPWFKWAFFCWIHFVVF